MARGWESKEVESQIEQRATERALRAEPSVSPEQLARRQRRDSLQLSRKRVVVDLETSQSPRRREQLTQALAYLDEQLSQLSETD